MTLQKKTLLHMVRRAHSSCAPNTIYFIFSLRAAAPRATASGAPALRASAMGEA